VKIRILAWFIGNKAELYYINSPPPVDRPETVRKHAEGTRTFDQGAVEAAGQAERVKFQIICGGLYRSGNKKKQKEVPGQSMKLSS
jgi:hypothetical protein